MKKMIFPLLGLLATATISLAQPKFKFEEETHNFGVVKRGPAAGHTFEFTNVGTEPIIVMNVTPSCGCTNVDWSKNPVLPGQKGFIHLDLKTEEQHGSFHKEVYIQSNAVTPNGERRYTLYIKGEAKDEITEADLKKNKAMEAKKIKK
jgi:hypothetical protein